jgi:glycerophosphoryl diester phosphodiesterase
MKKSTLLAAFLLSALLATAQTKIIAHRGFSSIAPENTLIAFQKAIESNADYFELDVHQTKDDSLVVIHDASIDKTSSNHTKGKIAEMKYRDLDTVRVGYSKKFGTTYEKEKVPTLREALALAKGKIKVCIEIKVYGIEEEVLAIVNELGVQHEVIIFSFYYPVLARIRQLDPNIPILFLIGSADETTIDYAKVIEANAIGVGYGTTITRSYLDLAHQNGIEVWKWTVNKEEEMQELIDLELDGLITDFPDKAIQILRKN